MIVYPRLVDEDQLPPQFAQMLGDCLVQHSLLTDPFLVSGIRSYQNGDNIRDIHWPATARMQELQVRTHDYTSQSRLLVLLNGQTREDQWDGEMNETQPEIEYAISLAATLCVAVLQAGLTAGFGANMPSDTEGASTLLLPTGGANRQEELLTTMARLRMTMTRSFHTFLEDLRDLHDLDIVILSLYDSETLRDHVRQLQLQGNTVRLYIIQQEAVAYVA